jgi:hypothetical protein
MFGGDTALGRIRLVARLIVICLLEADFEIGRFLNGRLDRLL